MTEPLDRLEALSSRWQELFWALPQGEMRSKLRALESDIGRALQRASLVAPSRSRSKTMGKIDGVALIQWLTRQQRDLEDFEGRCAQRDLDIVEALLEMVESASSPLPASEPSATLEANITDIIRRMRGDTVSARGSERRAGFELACRHWADELEAALRQPLLSVAPKETT